MTFKGTLYPYQQEALEVILDRKKALVAYEMGLGKTPSALAGVEAFMDSGDITEPGIIFTLSSLKYQWGKSIEKFTDSGYIVIDGTPAQREKQYEQVRDWMDSGVDYFIMNYETLVNDYQIVEELPLGFAVFDESSALKSGRSQRHKAVRELTKDVEVKIGLTGTPMSNGKPDEIYHQMRIVDPKVLGGYHRFDSRYVVRNRFGWIVDYRDVPELHKKLSVAMVSKKQTDPDVAPYMPKTIYRDPIMVKADRATKTLYNTIRDALLSDLEEAAHLLKESFEIGFTEVDPDDPEASPADRLRGSIGAKTTALRMLCSHPELLRTSAANYRAGTGGSKYIAKLDEEGHLDKAKRSPKLEALVEYVRDFLETDERNKVVIFSTFVETLEHIQNALKYETETYSGKMNAKEKEAARERFQTDPKVRALISSDAGGYGVDLPQANLLINYDLPWSAGTAAQRNGRIRRASSEFSSVVIQNMLMDGSIEEWQSEKLLAKMKMEAAVVDGKGFNKHGNVDLNTDTLRAYIKTNSI